MAVLLLQVHPLLDKGLHPTHMPDRRVRVPPHQLVTVLTFRSEYLLCDHLSKQRSKDCHQVLPPPRCTQRGAAAGACFRHREAPVRKCPPTEAPVRKCPPTEALCASIHRERPLCASVRQQRPQCASVRRERPSAQVSIERGPCALVSAERGPSAQVSAERGPSAQVSIKRG
uniref:Uncharacterized protein n=1 Tax=Rangifer tarandus platyrhynchus TaxID=3082113 RepID=A0ACB0DTD7_RANTA|nr:unnamed protein product [Rangifer tarandus platyrhynchus]